MTENLKSLSTKLAVASLITIGITACNTTGSSREETTQTAQSTLPSIPDYWSSVAAELGDVKIGWIEAFNDPLLVQLVQEVQANNKNLQAAASSVDRSWALAKQAGAALKPALGLSATGSRGGSIDTSAGTNVNVGVQASWEVDLWGRVRSGRQAAVASAEAAEADYKYSQHSLAAGVASAYFIAIEAEKQLEIAQGIFDALAEIKRIVTVQQENGLASAQDVALAKADLATAKDTLSATEGASRDAARALELLLGRYPSADLHAGSNLPEPPPQPSVGLPSEILERRPDLIAADRRVAAAMNSLNASKAAKLPQINLTANIGGASSELSNLLDPTNVAWSAASNLLAPLFDGGALDAQVEINTAEQEQAIAAYAQAALAAFGEVETALDLGQILVERVEALSTAKRESEEALRLANLNYAEGEIGLIDILTIQQRVFGAQSNLLSIQRSQLDQFLNLNLALGGDWRSY